MKFTILNDLHLGVSRMGGTTPSSAQSLRDYTQRMFRQLMDLGTHVVINGDMFDTYQVATMDLLQAYISVSEWLASMGEKLYLVPGNHDLAKNSAALSSFELLARLLIAQYPDKVSYLVGGNWVDKDHGIYAISHVPNQDLFQAELDRVPSGTKYLLLHCNFDNAFAAEAQHSLNLSRAQAKELVQRDITVILGHEHQGRTMMKDKVVIVGNQFPTSVADCLSHGDGQKDGHKYCLVIDGDDMELVPTWSVSDQIGGFMEIDWEALKGREAYGQLFVRVSGTATSAQAADVVRAISAFRQANDCFVITNAVKVESADGAEDLAQSVEDIRAVDVIQLLLEQLDPAQQAVVRKLLSEQTA